MSIKPLISKAQQWLKTVGVKELTQATRTEVDKENIWLDQEPLYIRTKIGVAGEVELLTAALDESVGITNIDKKKLAKYVNFIITHIQFAYATATTASAKKAVEVQYDSIIANVPVALQHANFIIKQNDTPVFTMPVMQLLQQEKLREFEGDAGFELDFLRMIKEEVPIQISIKFPEGQALSTATNDHFVAVHLKGARTRLRGAK